MANSLMEVGIFLFGCFLTMSAIYGMLVIFLLMNELRKDIKHKGTKTAIEEWLEEIRDE